MALSNRWIAAGVAACLVVGSAAAFARSKVIFSGNTGCRDIALTYDVEFADTTQELADTIDSLGIKTSWFFLGDSVDAYPGIVQQVAKHNFVGNHTLNHPEMPKLSEDEMYRQLSQSAANIKRVAGVDPAPYWRPPYGEYDNTTLDVADEAGYPYTIMWSVDTEDWNGPSVETIHQRIVQNAEPGAIVLQHGFPPNSIQATRLAVADLRQMGYQFVTIPEIIGNGRDQRDFGGDTYVVQNGDTFDYIGRCHNVTGSRIQAYNQLQDLVPGTTMKVPHKDEVIVRLDGARQEFAVYPRLVGKRAFVHVRLAEKLGAAVDWDGAKVIITVAGKRIEVTPGRRKALVDDKQVDMGTDAFFADDRVMVPARFLAEQLGRQVDFDGATYTVNIH